VKRIVIESKITCPECNHKEAETMPYEVFLILRGQKRGQFLAVGF